MVSKFKPIAGGKVYEIREIPVGGDPLFTRKEFNRMIEEIRTEYRTAGKNIRIQKGEYRNNASRRIQRVVIWEV